jgi:DNA sulfur modification protein DndD
MTQIDVIRTDGKKHQEELKEVRSKIQARHDIPDVPKLQIKKEHLENQERELLKQIALLEAELENKQSALEEKNEILRTLKKRQKQTNDTVKQWMLGTAAQEALGKTIASFKGKARQYLEEQCNVIGGELFWREGVYTIHINEEYFISVTSPTYGEIDLLAGMSMGVTQMTGLALIAALAKQTKAAAPLIMDTPFARLGPAHITRALAECPKHFAQWILFLQPSEWRDTEYRKVLGPRIQREYTLKRDNKTGKTEAVVGYQPKHFGKTKG